MTHAHYTLAEINRAVSLRLGGWHPREIAFMLQPQRSVSAIHRLLSIEKHKRGILYPKLRNPLLKWNAEKIEALALCIRRNPAKSYRQIGREEFDGISPPRISALMAKRAHALQGMI